MIVVLVGFVVTLALVLSHQGRGGLMVGLYCFGYVTPRPSGLRVKSAMTVGFAKVSIKGEADSVGIGLLSPHPVDTALKPV